MIILGIETSCDETAVSLIEADGGLEHPIYEVLGNALYSQVKIHAQYGGVFPALAKREHAHNLVPLLKKTLGEAKLPASDSSQSLTTSIDREKITKILERESGLAEALLDFIITVPKPRIDCIAVTAGPGLEPALWVGINFALALGQIWHIPVLPVNHMEGHIVSALFNAPVPIAFPLVALLISGGHTELVLMNDWRTYRVIGQTRDDAAGEAFDKIARILGLPYPGGPTISALANEARINHTKSQFPLPRPMIDTDNLDFSFSGLKTAALYTVRDIEKNAGRKITDAERQEIALETENAITEVLVAKTKKAVQQYQPKTLVVAGGVSANNHIRTTFGQTFSGTHAGTPIAIHIPDISLSTDNAVMIALAGYIDWLSGKKPQTTITANGTLSL